MLSTRQVVENHVEHFREGNIDAILANYSDDAILFTPGGILKGRDEIAKLFQAIIAEFGKPGGSDEVHVAIFESDYAYLVWSAETADNVYELATDTFVVRDGQIRMQSFAAKITSKSGLA